MRPGPVKNALIVLIMAVMVIQGLAIAGPIENPDQLNQGDIRLLTFPEFGGEQAISIEVPSEGTVVEAELEMTGLQKTYPSVNTGFSFNNEGKDHDAWKGSSTKRPPSSQPKNMKNTAATLSNEQDIATSDNKYWRHKIDAPWITDPWGKAIPTYPWQHFEFDISNARNTLDQISVSWEGHGVTDSTTRICGAKLFIWDPGDLDWALLDEYEENCNLVVDKTLSGTTSIPAIQQDSWKDSKVNVLIQGVFNDSGTYTTISTDDIDLTVRSHTVSWPSDLKVDVGDDDVIEHTYQGKVAGKKTFGGSEGFVDALQEIIDNSDGGSDQFDVGDNITVLITFNSSTGGQLSVKMTGLKVDTPPKMAAELPGIAVDEDSELDNALDLWEYFRDDEGVENLTYHVDWNERPGKINVWIPGNRNVKVTTLSPDWSGDVKVRFSASDTYEQTVLSNNVTVTVRPMNDPPALIDPGVLTAYENQMFLLDIDVTDADRDDTHIFTDDTDLFDIEPATGEINFTPRTEDIGVHEVNITVTDSNGSMDYKVVDLEVKNVNDPPTVSLYLPTDGFITTVDRIKLVWTGDDPDGDRLTYNVLMDSGNGLTQIATDVKDTEHLVTDLKNGTTYRWTVVASDGKLQSAQPDPFSFKAEIDEGGTPGPGPGPQPNQPPSVELLSPEKGSEVGTLAPTFSWEGYDPDGDQLSYEILVYDNVGTLLHQKKTNVAYFKLTEALENEQRFFWTVVPFDGEDHGICVDGQWYFNTKKTGQQEAFDPVINVTVSPEGDIDLGTKLTFDASASHDPDGAITLYIWTLGDGTTLTGPTYTTIDHTFEKGGLYNVSLVVFDNDGNTGIWSYSVNVIEEVDPPPPEPNDGWLTADQLMIALLITAMAVAFGTAAAFMAYRKIKYGRYKVDQVFLVYKDGRLIGHEGSEEDGEDLIGKEEASEKEVMGGMLAAVQAFVKDSLKDEKAKGSLKVLEYGDHKIAIERGEETFLAAFVTGNVTPQLRERMQDTVLEIEVDNQNILKDWDGSQDDFKGIGPSLMKFME